MPARGSSPPAAPAIELRAATEVGTGARGGRRPRRPRPARRRRLAELLAHVRVPLWRGPTEGRVRILSPYRLRATRVAHLFVAGLADGSFPAAGGGDPLLSDERRRALGLLVPQRPGRRGALPLLRLRVEAGALPPPLLPGQRRGRRRRRRGAPSSTRSATCSPPPRPPTRPTIRSRPELIERATLADFVPAPEDASAPHDLARALAAVGADADERAAALDAPRRAPPNAPSAAVADGPAPGPRGSRPRPAQPPRRARRRWRDTTCSEPRPSRSSTCCSYRWFVNHELEPRRIEPDPEPLENGGIVHATLERLFREPPGDERPADAGERSERWIERARGIVREVAAERGWDLEAAAGDDLAGPPRRGPRAATCAATPRPAGR